MESNFNSENFERFLRESSDQYRMYPSENVWKNIYNRLHTRRRWFGIGLILFLSAGFVTTFMLTNSSVGDNINRQATEKKIDPSQSAIDNKETTESIEKENNPITVYRNNYSQKERSTTLRSFEISQDNVAVTPALSILTTEQTLSKDISSLETTEQKAPLNATAGITKKQEQEAPIVFVPIDVHLTDEATDQDTYTWTMNNSPVSADHSNRQKAFSNSITANNPLTIESVINSYARKNKKLSLQFYFTPNISYRKLNENKSYLNSGSGYSNINSAVTHKPDMGLEVGVTTKYAITKNLKLRGGIQFNTSRYDIKAYSSPAERATIALNTGGYTVDSVSTTSNYRNFNGYRSDWLHNFYFQISAPVGLELNLAGDDKVQFGVAGTLQPTYIIGDRAYLLSSNYKNYAEVPWLIRRWNMNTSFEAFVSYSTGKMNWQIGPQVRYQLLSSFVKEYPVKEHLFDFGLRIGVSIKK
ncbi:MAG: hypothetical protein QM764_07135 [Chitinophagaceae bacterium]